MRLPCGKVYPIGPVYLASLMRRAGASDIRILDLAIPQSKGAADPRAWGGCSDKSRLFEEIEAFSPDLVAFSWRDLQVFSPQDSDQGFRDVYAFLYERSLLRRLAAAFRGLGELLTYTSVIAGNLALVAEAARAFPKIEIALGGPAVRIFGDRLSPRLPSRVRVFSESELGPFFEFLGLKLPANPGEPELDLEFIESAFHQWPSYAGATIGVQTKLGCPRTCLYCLYPRLEGKTPRRRSPVAVAAEVEAYARRWGSRRFWLADAQLLGVDEDRPHLEEILERIAALGLGIEWSGYFRVSEVDSRLASIMVRSGLFDLELSLGSGSQRIVDSLRLGFQVEDAIRGLENFKEAGYSGRVLVNLSLNAPGETVESLGQSLAAIDRIRDLFGPDRVVPVPFFLAIQPGTGLEALAFEEGLLRPGYDPLSIWPWRARRLIYNPRPLGPMIGRACAEAFRGGNEGRGDRVLAAISRELK